MTDIKSMTQEEITDALRAMGEPAFRGKQVFSWLHKGATAFAEMNNLSKPLREKLGKTGTVIGCDTSNCGACTVHLNGTSVKSCNVLAVQADAGEVTTIEGLAQEG